MKEAKEHTQADATVIYVPLSLQPKPSTKHLMQTLKLSHVLLGIPVLDMVEIKKRIIEQQTYFIGPNCPGLVTPGEVSGIMPGFIHQPGKIGIVSRSGTLTYEAVWQTSQVGLGQTTCVGMEAILFTV